MYPFAVIVPPKLLLLLQSGPMPLTVVLKACILRYLVVLQKRWEDENPAR
jgi:hypothetical protein